MAMTYEEAYNIFYEGGRINRYTFVSHTYTSAGARLLRMTYRGFTIFLVDSHNNYVVLSPSRTHTDCPLRTDNEMRKIILMQQKYTPAQTMIINGQFAIRMRPNRGNYVPVPNLEVSVDCYGNVISSFISNHFDSFSPVAALLSCVLGKEHILPDIVTGDDGERLRKKRHNRRSSESVTFDSVFDSWGPYVERIS